MPDRTSFARERLGRASTPASILGLSLAAAALLAPPAGAADILAAAYDPSSDRLVVDIAYRGTNPAHRFSILWEPCSGEAPQHAAGRLVDAQGQDEARVEYRVRQRLSLEGMQCRPAVVTLRLGRVAHVSVYVPAAP